MKKALVISDTHGNGGVLTEILRREQDYDTVIFLGDGLSEFFRATRNFAGTTFCARGNNDFTDEIALSSVVLLWEHSLLICHGHTFRVRMGLKRLALAAEQNGCEIALFGHTHKRTDCEIDGIHLFNPGSASLPRSGSASYGVIFEDGGKLFFSHENV